MSAEIFDFEEHERQVNERYIKLATYDAFDRFVDLALDGLIDMEQALKAFEEEYGEGSV